MTKYLILKRNKETEKIKGARPMGCLVELYEIRNGSTIPLITREITTRYLVVTLNGEKPPRLQPEDIVYEYEE